MKRLDHNNGSYVPFSLREVGGFSYVPFLNQYREDAGDGARGLEQLTVCRCHGKGSTFASVIKDPECVSGRSLNPPTPARQPRLNHLC